MEDSSVLERLKMLPAPGQRGEVAGAISMMGLREGRAVLLVFPLSLTSSPLLSAGRFKSSIWWWLCVSLLALTGCCMSFRKVNGRGQCGIATPLLEELVKTCSRLHVCKENQFSFEQVSIRKINCNHSGIYQHNLGPWGRKLLKSVLRCKEPNTLVKATCPPFQDWNQRLFLWSVSASRAKFSFFLGALWEILCSVYLIKYWFIESRLLFF